MKTCNVLVSCLLAIVPTGFLFGQNTSIKRDTIYGYEKDSATGNSVRVQYVLPAFVGGATALSMYLANNTMYPAAAREADAEGIVFVNFTVEADGSISNIAADSIQQIPSRKTKRPTKREKIIKPNDLLLKAEAERVVRNMPKWLPGLLDGKLVPVHYHIPIKFELL